MPTQSFTAAGIRCLPWTYGAEQEEKKTKKNEVGLLLSISRSSTARPNVRRLPGLPAERHPQGGAPGQTNSFPFRPQTSSQHRWSKPSKVI